MAIAAAVVATAVALYLVFSLPSRALQLTGPLPGNVVFGAYHVHTSRSDGAGSVDDVARAAARSGLAFVILTDHGDLTRPPDPPAYREGVLCIDAAEVSTADGHVVALGVRQAAPYPVAGEGRDVIADIHRLGGWAILAHPDSPKPQLRWQAWDVPYDGIEWLNADSEWRDETARTLIGAALHSLVRAPETVASLFKKPARTLQRWDAALGDRPVFAVAGVDAHARMIGWEEGDRSSRTIVGWPTYADMFRTVTQAVELDQPLTKDAGTDAERLIAALVAGRGFSVVNALAGPAALEFSGVSGAATVGMGGFLPPNTTIRARVRQAPGARVVLIGNGREMASGTGSVEYSGSVEPGAYRVEVYLPGLDMPWIVSNPIYGPKDEAGAAPGGTAPDAPATAVPLVPISLTDGWSIERDERSMGEFGLVGDAMRFGFRLGSENPTGQYAALVATVADESGFDRVQFTARADRPRRMSLQVRLRGARDGQRWRRSIYVDPMPRPISIRLQEFEPVDRATSQRPVVAPIHSVLFVIDTLNTRPGTAGAIWISDLTLGVGKTDKD
jgi:hypothetical protein